jgi:outer membrane immunogenic protein
MGIAAKAADLAPAYPVKAKTSRALVPSWTGFYIGPSIGWTFGSSEGDYTGFAIPTMVFYPFDLKPSGAALGGQLGYNLQFGSWLFGIEGDLSWIVNADDRIWDPAGSARYDEIKLLWTGHARGRVGYLFDQYLIYFAGGAAFAGTRNSHYGPTTPPVGMLWSERRTRTGYSLGGGIEAALNAQWLVRAEYLYDRFGNEFFDWVTGTRYSNSDLTLNTIRVGIVFRP